MKCGQGNVFTGICLSTGGSLYDVTSHLATWSYVPSGEVSVKGVSVKWRVCERQALREGDICEGGLCGLLLLPSVMAFWCCDLLWTSG